MKKDELVHLHDLLGLVRADLEGRGVVEPAAFDAYEALDISPVAIYGPKADHERAVCELAGALAAAVESTDEPDVSVAST